MDRRKFFSFLPLGAVVAGAAIVSESQKEDKPTRNILTLQGGINGFTPPQPTVDFSIGKDGKLWIRSSGDDWKRVMTEG